MNDKLELLSEAQGLIEDAMGLLRQAGAGVDLRNALFRLAYGKTNSIEALKADLEDDIPDDSWIDRAIDERQDKQFGLDKE